MKQTGSAKCHWALCTHRWSSTPLWEQYPSASSQKQTPFTFGRIEPRAPTRHIHTGWHLIEATKVRPWRERPSGLERGDGDSVLYRTDAGDQEDQGIGIRILFSSPTLLCSRGIGWWVGKHTGIYCAVLDVQDEHSDALIRFQKS